MFESRDAGRSVTKISEVSANNLPDGRDPKLVLTTHEFVVHGVTTSADAFCGCIAGYVQLFGTSPADRIRLEGSTFGAVRISGPSLPAPAVTCAHT